MKMWRALGAAWVAGSWLGAAPAAAAEFPAATVKYLQQAHLSADIMKGIDQELAVPGDWIEGARREGTVRIIGEWDPKQFAIINAPFAERYPWLRVVHTQASTMNARAVAPLVAFKQGQYIADIVTGFGGAVPDYKKENALVDLSALPGLANQINGANDPENGWAGIKARYWCMAYNTRAVKAEDLPATWEDLLTNPVWRNGEIGIGNRPQLWALMLRNAKGREWLDDYLKKFFEVLKPQFRGEGMEAVLGIMVAGEFNAILPAAADTVRAFENKGAPISWHCPDPVPFLATQMGILAGNPHMNAAKMWANWMLSREAQLGQFIAEGSPPVNKALQVPQLTVYPEKTVGRHLVQGREEQVPEVYAMWRQYWK
jgi:ABC-type Fe3+ transport system substrate-binding protein